MRTNLRAFGLALAAMILIIGLRTSHPFDGKPLLLPVLLLFCFLWARFTFWSWATVKRMSLESGDRGTWRIGVLGWGLWMWLFMSYPWAAEGVRSTGWARLADGAFYSRVILNAFLGAPIWMWGGFVFGQLFWKGTRPQRKSESTDNAT